MKRFQYRPVVLVAVTLVALGAVLGGCFGGDDNTTTTTVAVVPGGGGTTSTIATDVSVDPNAELSTFRSKDPFISQAQPPATSEQTSTTSGGSTGGSTGTTSGGTVTTIYVPVINPTTVTTSSGGGGATSSTTQPPTSSTTTTAPHLHTLKVLAASAVGGAAAVTFQVDGSVYRDRRVGDVVSTSWGQIKVLDINTSSNIVTLLQGSETLVLSVGQLIYQ